MSLINDALKQARRTPPRSAPDLPPLQPVAAAPVSATVWLIPALVIVLIVSAILLILWVSAHHAVRTVEIAPAPVAAGVPSAPPVPVATIAPAALDTPPPKPAPPLLPPPAVPKLQGIFYSPTAPSAIVDGKIVRPGDRFRQYRVKEISRNTVTLVGPDNEEIQIGMGR